MKKQYKLTALALTACLYWNIPQTNGTSMATTPALRTESSMGLR